MALWFGDRSGLLRRVTVGRVVKPFGFMTLSVVDIYELL